MCTTLSTALSSPYIIVSSDSVGLKVGFISYRTKHLRLLKTSVGNLGTDSLITHAHRSVWILAASVWFKCSNRSTINTNIYVQFVLSVGLVPQNGLGILYNVESDIVEGHSFLSWKNVSFYMPRFFSVMQDKKNVLLAFFEHADIIFHGHCIYFYYWVRL